MMEWETCLRVTMASLPTRLGSTSFLSMKEQRGCQLGCDTSVDEVKDLFT